MATVMLGSDVGGGSGCGSGGSLVQWFSGGGCGGGWWLVVVVGVEWWFNGGPVAVVVVVRVVVRLVRKPQVSPAGGTSGREPRGSTSEAAGARLASCFSPLCEEPQPKGPDLPTGGGTHPATGKRHVHPKKGDKSMQIIKPLLG